MLYKNRAQYGCVRLLLSLTNFEIGEGYSLCGFDLISIFKN